MMGLLGRPAALILLVRTWWLPTYPGSSSFSASFLATVIPLGILVHGPPNDWGVTMYLLPVVLLGITLGGRIVLAAACLGTCRTPRRPGM